MENSSSHVDNDTYWFLFDCTLTLDREGRRMALFLLYLLLFTVGLLENLLVLWVNWQRRRALSGVLFGLFNVCLSDLMVVLVVPFYMLEVTIHHVWLWGHFMCKLTYFVYTVNMYSSSFFVAYMTLERYRSVLRQDPSLPAPPARPRTRWLICGGLWLLAMLLTSLENMHIDLLEWEEPGCYVLPEYNLQEWFASLTCLLLLFQFLLPAGVIVVCNALLARDLRGRGDVWLLHVYSLAFVACWLPYHLVMVLITVDSLIPYLLSCDATEVLYYSYSVLQCLTLLHCVANPILYSFLSTGFRRTLVNTVVEILSRGAPESRERNTGRDEEAGGGAAKGRRPTSSSTSDSTVNP